MFSTKSVLIALAVAAVAVQDAVAYEKYMPIVKGSTKETAHPGGDTSVLTDLAKAFAANKYIWDMDICETHGVKAGLKCEGLPPGSSQATNAPTPGSGTPTNAPTPGSGTPTNAPTPGSSTPTNAPTPQTGAPTDKPATLAPTPGSSPIPNGNGTLTPCPSSVKPVKPVKTVKPSANGHPDRCKVKKNKGNSTERVPKIDV